MGLVTLIFDLLTLKLVRESRQRWGTLLLNLGTLGLWVLELFAMYATDERTDKCNAYCPLPYGRGYNKAQLGSTARSTYEAGSLVDFKKIYTLPVQKSSIRRRN